MDDLADIARTAVGRQRFAYVGMTAVVLVVASFSNTERRLFEGGALPSAFSAVPAPLDGAPAAFAAALPLLRSFAFRRPEVANPTAGIRPVVAPALPGAGLPSRPVEIAALTPAAAPEAVGQGTGGSSAGSGLPTGLASGPASGFVTPAGAGQPTTTLPVGGGGGGGGGTTTPPGTGTTTPPGTGTTTPPGTGTTTPPGTGTTTPPPDTGTTTPPNTGTTTPPNTGTTTPPNTGTTTPPNTGTTTPPNTGTNPPTPAVPEPATWAMMLTGFFCIGLVRRGRRRAIRQPAA